MKSKTTLFEGLCPDVKRFFQELKENNNKEWFAEHKPFYERHIKEPLRLLVENMNNRFFELGLPYIGDTRKSLFRIYRDIRFSSNKEPYKTNLGVYFPYTISQKGTKPVDSLGLYFHLDADETFIAAGIHCPLPPVLKTIRDKISLDWRELIDIISSRAFHEEYNEKFYGDSLKSMPRGFPKDHPAAELLRLKEYTVLSDLQYEDTYTVELLNILERKAVAAMPFLDFLSRA